MEGRGLICVCCHVAKRKVAENLGRKSKQRTGIHLLFGLLDTKQRKPIVSCVAAGG